MFYSQAREKGEKTTIKSIYFSFCRGRVTESVLITCWECGGDHQLRIDESPAHISGFGQGNTKKPGTPTPWLTLLLVLGKSRVKQKSR